MITEDFVSFEVAKLLKEKGFDYPTLHYYYDKDGDLVFSWNIGAGKNEFVAPTLQMAMKWLRGMGWFICIIPLAFYCGEVACKFGYNIWAGDNPEIDEFNTPKFNTYEEACEDGIKYCLENLI